MRWWGRVFSRFTLVSLAILAQLFWMFFFIHRLSDHYMIVAAAFNFVTLIAAVIIVNKNGNPMVKMAWIVPILVFPLFGGILYFLSGGKAPKKKLRRALETSRQGLAPFSVGNASPDDIVTEQMRCRVGDADVAGQCHYLERQGFPLYRNTDARYYADCKAGWNRMLEDLRGAERFIFLEYFIIREGIMWNAVLDILTEKAAAGVDVRLLYDDFGCITCLPRDYVKQMEARGIRCTAFNRYRPVYSVVMNHRDHRKIFVVDGYIGYTGGANMSDEYIGEWVRFGDWKDNFVRLEGEGVRGLTLLFLQMWNALHPEEDADIARFLPPPERAAAVRCPGYVQPYGDSPMDSEVLAENVYLNIITQAVQYVYIFSPYLITDYEMTRALCLAAKRGVDVRLVCPAVPDKKIVFQLTKSHYPELIANGVKVYSYTPGFLHSKTFLSDDRLAVVGSVNMDYRSLTLHFENACLFVDHPMAEEVKQDFLQTFEVSQPVVPGKKQENFLYRFWLGFLRLLSPLM